MTYGYLNIGEEGQISFDGWTLTNGQWVEPGAIIADLPAAPEVYNDILLSPFISLKKGRIYNFILSLQIAEGGIWFYIRRQRKTKPVKIRPVKGKGFAEVTLRIKVRKDGAYQLGISNYPQNDLKTQFQLDKLFYSSKAAAFHQNDMDTTLPHWNVLQRGIHSWCKSSRQFNSFMSGMEMRLDKEEVLSLPQYMGLCPTGLCNALCSFCSVTHNRDGILKKELPFERLISLLAPVLNTIRLLGIEGNGEPTLFSRFYDLLDMLGEGDAPFYLITNGERLNPKRIDLLIANNLNAINFSLNAATSLTHKKVMRLEDFETVIENIKHVMRFAVVDLASLYDPSYVSYQHVIISISYVVNHDNIHEVLDFLRFAEFGLGVYKIYLHPLSELANVDGVVEDFRNIVPYENDIKDMCNAVQEYLELTERQAQIYFDAANFKTFRQDPLDRILMPPGYEERWLPPRKKDWQQDHPDLQVTWSLTGVSLKIAQDARAGIFMRSVLIPVEPHKELTFQCKVHKLEGSAITFTMRNSRGTEMGSIKIIPLASDALQKVILPFSTQDNETLELVISYESGLLNAEIDFERLRTPGRGVLRKVKLPSPHHWQIDSPGVQVHWLENKVSIRWDGKPGPYLYRSFTFACWQNAVVDIPADIAVFSGKLAIGVLSEDRQKWVNTFIFNKGEHATILHIETKENRRLQIVLYSNSEDPLDAEVDWHDHVEPLPEIQAKSNAVSSISEQSFVQDADKRNHNINRKTLHNFWRSQKKGLKIFLKPTSGRIGDIAKGKVKYYCQKPWTDMQNFTVDGRMDVCCIATGASQEYYALGNIVSQSFQDIWNGERMREFRRTVNSAEKLPPCQRCPQAYAYQGPWFNLQDTDDAVHTALYSVFSLPKLFLKIFNVVYYSVLHWMVFRGFKPKD